MRKHFILVFVVSLLMNAVQAQECLENLYKANRLLDAGNTSGCLNLVRPCSVEGNEESVRWQAYRLMSIAWLLGGNTDSARMAAENMLDIHPTYKPNLLKDTREFIQLLNSIVVIPKFTLGLAFSAGSNLTFPRISAAYAVSDYRKTYTTRNGIQFGTSLGFYLDPRIVTEVGFLATSRRFDIDYAFSGWEVNISERQTGLDIPVTLKYLFRTREKLRLFVQGGGFASFMLYAQNDFRSTYKTSEQGFELRKLNILERRNTLGGGITGGIGAYYRTGGGHLSFSAAYYHSFTRINKAGERYQYPDQIYTYYYVDDDIRLNSLSISLGYTYYLNYRVYRPKAK